MARKRINLNAICSSDNYEKSKKLHKDFIREVHYSNEILLEEIKAKRVLTAYVKCFGKLIPITLEEAEHIKKTVTIIYK